MRRVLLLLLLVCAGVCSPWGAASGAVSAREAASPLDDVSWLAGQWLGKTGSGAFIEESWMAARDGLMLGSFRWDRGKGRWLFEFMTLEVDPASPATLVLRLKHFDRGFKGFEEKTESTTFRSVEASESRVVFELKRDQGGVRLTYARTGADGLQVTFEETEAGKPPTRIDFSYTRVK
jgi:hypothetical protein